MTQIKKINHKNKKQKGKCFDKIYFGNKSSKDLSVVHSGDNLTGKGEGDDERINVNVNSFFSTETLFSFFSNQTKKKTTKLSSLSKEITCLVFTITIYTSSKNFSQVKNAYVRLIDGASQKEFCRYNLTELGNKNALIMCRLIRISDTKWNIHAIGESATGTTVVDLVSTIESKYSAKTAPSSHTPASYSTSTTTNPSLYPNSNISQVSHSTTITNNAFVSTINLTIVGAKDLLAMDSNGFSDPYIKINKPPQKTKVIKKTLTPTWNETFPVVFSHLSPTLELECWDQDTLKDDFIGKASISLVDIPSDKETDMWVDLKTKTGGPAGKLNIKLIKVSTITI